MATQTSPIGTSRSVTPAANQAISNQPPPLVDYNAFSAHAALAEAVRRSGADWAEPQLAAFGKEIGSEELIEAGYLANENPPELLAYDRRGERFDRVTFHPAWHRMMEASIKAGVHALNWVERRPGANVARAAAFLLMNEAENGISCPLGMTHASVAPLRRNAALAAQWEPHITSCDYDPSFAPMSEKRNVLIGMAMTEREGGSDVAKLATRARRVSADTNATEFELFGDKWFFSAPNSDAFLTLAATENGLTCFLVPRFRPDGSVNRIELNRLKDKLGDRSNATAEASFAGAWATAIGEEGKGIRTILEMVHYTRLNVALCSTGIMHQAVWQALHYAGHRTLFQKKLNDHPLMQNVLADLALESEAAVALVMRIAHTFDAPESDAEAHALGRIGVALAKYWITKRTPWAVFEAMECLGGNGYIEDYNLARLYRQAPLNSIWEGSANVICLDVLRAIERVPAALPALRNEISLARGADRRFDRFLDRLDAAFFQESSSSLLQAEARMLAEKLALALQASLLLRYSTAAVSDAFCASRLDGEWGHVFGTLPQGIDRDSIIRRANPLPA
jgi:putative acyl-CoA dehydrogenase